MRLGRDTERSDEHPSQRLRTSEPGNSGSFRDRTTGVKRRPRRDDLPDAVTTAHPRPDFKRRILQTFADGNLHRPDSTYGTINADVLAHFDPAFVRDDFVDVILNSGWPE